MCTHGQSSPFPLLSSMTHHNPTAWTLIESETAEGVSISGLYFDIEALALAGEAMFDYLTTSGAVADSTQIGDTMSRLMRMQREKLAQMYEMMEKVFELVPAPAGSVKKKGKIDNLA